MSQTELMPPPGTELRHGVSWEEYEAYLEERDLQGLHTRVTYDNGDMEMMTTGGVHERAKKLIARLLEYYATELDIDITGYGEVTLKRKDLRKGLDPDECYYVGTPPPPPEEDATVPLDIKRFGPPDLAIEVEVTRRMLPKQPIYAALGVAEIWRWDGEHVIFLGRRGDGTYHPIDPSSRFPKLAAADFNRFVQIGLTKGQPAAVRAMRDWLRR